MFIFGRQLQVEIIQPEILKEVQDEREQAFQLITHLLAGAVDVRIILGQAAHAGKPMYNAGFLITVNCAELKQPQREFTV